MTERTPLLEQSKRTPGGRISLQENDEELRGPVFQPDTGVSVQGPSDVGIQAGHSHTHLHVQVSVRSRSVPPSGQCWEQDGEGKQYGSRPKTSLGHSAGDEATGLGDIFDAETSGGNEDEAFLNKETSKEMDTSKAKVMNIVMMNIVLIIWSISGNIHNPVWTQYFFRRIEDEIFGNISHTGDNSSSSNATRCYKPLPNVNHSHDGISKEDQAQQMASKMSMLLSVTGTFCGLFSTMLVSAYSDYFGRKVLFLIPMFGHLIDYTVTTIIIYWSLNINLFFVTTVITGICSSSIFNIACYVYVADNTPPKASRTMGLVVMEFTQNLANAALATGVGYYIQLEGYFLPALTASAIMLMGILAVVVILPDTKPMPTDSISKKRQEKEKKALNPLKAVRNIFSFYLFDGTIKTRIMYIILGLAMFFHKITLQTGNIGTLWEMTYPLCWSPEMMGYYLTGTSIFSQLIRLPVLKLSQCCMNDAFIAIWSNIAYTGSMILKAFVSNNTMMYGVSFLGAFDIASASGIQAIMSKMAGPERQGALFGSLSIVDLVCLLIGEPIFSGIYQNTVDLFKGMIFLVISGLQCVAIILIVVYVVLSRGGNHRQVEHIRNGNNGITPEVAPSPRDEDNHI